MRPAGMLILPEIAIWLDLPQDNHCRRVRYILAKAGIEPAVKGTARQFSMWRWTDLKAIAHLAPGARSGHHLEAAA